MSLIGLRDPAEVSRRLHEIRLNEQITHNAHLLLVETARHRLDIPGIIHLLELACQKLREAYEVREVRRELAERAVALLLPQWIRILTDEREVQDLLRQHFDVEDSGESV
jgi:hypothetical protein